MKKFDNGTQRAELKKLYDGPDPITVKDPIEVGMNDDFIEFNDLKNYEIGQSRLFKTDFTLVDRENKILTNSNYLD